MDQITSAQFSEWEAYDKLDPIGSWRSDFNAAHIISTMTNIANSIYHEEGKPLIQTTIDEFMPIWDKEERKKRKIKTPEKQSPETLKDALLSFARSHNARLEKQNGQEGRRIRKVPPNIKK